MPETSDTVPIVTIFFGAAMLEMVVMIIATCVILKMHSADQPLPKWVRGLLYENLSYKLGIRHKTKVLPSDEEKKDSKTSYSKENNGYFHVPENNLHRIKLMRDQNRSLIDDKLKRKPILSRQGSNPRLLVYKTDALPTVLLRHGTKCR